ncbi:MAG TPA: type I-C CRISPR-associated protein Cas8c/Csd1 [Phycisphaerae bacterium]|nr:type I-C CRISPR-associated protein Cas8c/Csd1 [Phycisphaerae bacterium]
MILQRLAEYYDRVTADPKTSDALPKPGYSSQKISFCVVLNLDGSLHQIETMMVPAGKRTIPQMKLVPGQGKPSGSGINPCFLWDNSAYMLGYRLDDEKPDRTVEAFEAFRDRHLALEKEIDSDRFRAVCAFLRNWSPEKAKERATEINDMIGSFGVFRLAGEQQFVHDDPAVVTYWLQQSQADGEAVRGLCLVTGTEQPIARLHEPKIKGVREAQSSGALLVSFNSDAYTSFGKDQSYNAPVGETSVFKYANALNYLLSREDRRTFLGDATVVSWADKPTEDAEAISCFIASQTFAGEDASAEDKTRVRQVQNFLQQLREGYAGHEAVPAPHPDKPEDEIPFYILGLSPNASRISVRFWIPSTIGQMKERLGNHMRDIELVGASPESPLTIRRIVLATGRAEKDPKGNVKSYDADSISPQLSGAISRSILTGSDYPQMLLGAMLNRMKADGAINHPRVATIKAILICNSNKEISVALDTERKDPAYVVGRLFALLEKIQTDSADGNLNTTIKDRYFSAASATPGVVFPRLIRLSQHHLAKLDDGIKIFYDKKLSEVMNKLNGFAPHFTLENQGLFAVGYYHQRQDLYTKKNKEGASE